MNTTKIRFPGDLDPKTGKPDYFMTEAFNELRTNILFSGEDVKAIVITSCVPNEGKTVVSLHIAKSLAELGKRVLLIDADMRKSVMAGRNSDAQRAKGLGEVLIEQQTLEESIYATQYENFYVLFAGLEQPKNPADPLNGKKFDALLESVRKQYEYVIIDTAPLGVVIDAAVIASKCDSSILVIGSDHVKFRQAQDAVDKLRKAGSKVLGVVINQASTKHNGKKYTYGKYGYTYGKKY